MKALEKETGFFYPVKILRVTCDDTYFANNGARF